MRYVNVAVISTELPQVELKKYLDDLKNKAQNLLPRQGRSTMFTSYKVSMRRDR